MRKLVAGHRGVAGSREDDRLGFRQLLAYSFGGMIGSGWLLGVHNTAAAAGKFAWISWLIGGAAMLVIGVVMMELGRSWGRDGGLVWWPFNSSGPAVAMVVAAAIWIFYALNPASEAAAAVQFGSHWLPSLYDPRQGGRLTGQGLGASALLVVLLVAANLLGLRLITRITVIAGVLKVAVPVIVLALLIRSGFSTPHHPVHLAAHGGLGGILTAVTGGGVIYAYIGFQAPIDFGSRARDSERDIPPAVITPIIFGIVFFTLLQVLSTHDGVLGTGWNGISYDSPYARLAAGVAIWHLSLDWLVRLDTIVSPLGSGLVFSAALAHTIEDISRSQLIARRISAPRSARLGRGRKVSFIVLALNLMISLVFLPFLPDWSGLVGESSVITLFVYAVPSISHAALIKSRPPSVEHVVSMLRGGIISRHLGLASFSLMTLILYWADFRVLAPGAGLTLTLAAVLMLRRPGKWRPEKEPAPGDLAPGDLALGDAWSAAQRRSAAQLQRWPDSRRPALWLTGYLAGLVALCALRQYGPHGAVAWLWLAAAAALGVIAFRGLVASSAAYMASHPPETDPQAAPMPAVA